MYACFALRATTKAGDVEAGCCATVMRRAALWLETSYRHVRRVASRLSSPPLAPDTKRRLRGARKNTKAMSHSRCAFPAGANFCAYPKAVIEQWAN